MLGHSPPFIIIKSDNKELFEPRLGWFPNELVHGNLICS